MKDINQARLRMFRVVTGIRGFFQGLCRALYVKDEGLDLCLASIMVCESCNGKGFPRIVPRNLFQCCQLLYHGGVPCACVALQSLENIWSLFATLRGRGNFRITMKKKHLQFYFGNSVNKVLVSMNRGRIFITMVKLSQIAWSHSRHMLFIARVGPRCVLHVSGCILGLFCLSLSHFFV